MTDQLQKDWDRKARLAALLLLLAIILIILDKVVACSSGGGSGPTPPPAPTADCDGLKIDQTAEIDCPAGKTVKQCTATGLKVIVDQCSTQQKPPAKSCDQVVTFDKVQPIFGTDCAGCHAGLDQYENAIKTPSWGPNIRKHVDIKDATDPEHMPRGGTLSPAQVKLIDQWDSDGFLKAGDCQAQGGGGGGGTPPTPPPFQSFPQLEQTLQADLSKVSISDQGDVRWLVYTDRIDAGVSTDELATYKFAGLKGALSVSTQRAIDDSVKVVAPGVIRINIDDLGISDAQWKLVENASLLQMESFTNIGLGLKTQTKSRLPWLLVSEFNDTVLRNAGIYYNLTKSPATLQQLLVNLGVDFAGDLQNFKALQIGFNGSQLSPAANRLMGRWDAKTNGGYFWLTEDTGAIVSDKQNIFKNPLIAAGGGQANLQFAAGEMIYTLPNGLQGYFLADAKGKRLDQADPAVVHDFTTNPVSPIIKNAISCMRCHYNGIIHGFDHVRDSALQPGSQLGANDAQRVLALYKPQSEIDEKITEDNALFSTPLKAVGIDPTVPDPISKVSDHHLGDLTLQDVASMHFQTVDQFTTSCLNVSARVREQAGQLLAKNGTISHDQLVQVEKAIQQDCRTFQDPLTQGD